MAPRPLPQRIGRVLLGVVAMAAVVAVAGTLLWRQAPGWGIPYADFTNEWGSSCENTWTGHVCEPMTLPDLVEHTGISLPEGTEIERAAYTETHNFSVSARVVLPAGTSTPVAEQLAEEFGDCQEIGRNPLPPEWDRRCLRSSDGVRDEEGALPPTVWTVASAVPEDVGRLVVDIDLRSR